MATIKSYTDISQSKTLSKILPIESADMWWNFYSVTTDNTTPQIIHIDTPWVGSFNWNNKPDNIPCWSLAALLEVISKPDLVQNSEGTWLVRSWVNDYPWSVGGYSNPVDACVAMIEKLHEQNIL